MMGLRCNLQVEKVGLVKSTGIDHYQMKSRGLLDLM